MWQLALLGCGLSSPSRAPREAPEPPEPPAAVLFLSPSSLTFGTESSAQVLTLRSIGELPVNLDSVWIEGAAAFSVTDPGPLTLEPRDEVEVTVTFTASGVEESGSVEIASDAEYAPHSVPLVGAIPGPLAVCTADPATIAPGDRVNLLGDTSYDPSGRTLTDYEWTLLEKPEASVARVSSGGANRIAEPELAGTYVFELVVTNDAGVVSDPCTVAVEVIPTAELWIEITSPTAPTASSTGGSGAKTATTRAWTWTTSPARGPRRSCYPNRRTAHSRCTSTTIRGRCTRR